MSVTFQCGVCGHQYTVPAHMAGKWVRCKHCESTLEIPQPLPGSASRPRPSQKPLKQALPLQEPVAQPRPPRPSPADPPIPEAILVEAVPEVPARPTPALPDLTAPQPLRPTPLTAKSRPRVSASSRETVDKLAVLLAVGAVGIVFGVVVFMMIVIFGGGSHSERETAGGSRTPSDRSVGDVDGLGRINFSTKPKVQFGSPRTMSSTVPGVVWKEIPLKGNADEPAARGRLWVYLPAGNHEPASLGCVLIGPAGSRMVHGMQLGEGDQAEHYPYAEHGLAVVAFEIDGPLPDEEPADNQFRDAYLKFTAAAAGVANARVALQYATTELPEVDGDRIFVAGHSSAGTVALLCAEHLDGLAGCVAYAPCSDVEGFLSEFIDDIEGVLPNARQYMVDGSPMNHVEQLGCPVMVFHAVDDRIIRVSESNSFSSRGKQAGGNITLELVPRGGHYDSMINDGINKAVTWMNRIRPPASLAVASNSPPAFRETLPRPTPGFQTPSSRTPPRLPLSGPVRAYVHLEVASYPSGNAEVLARDALQPVIWAEPDSIRIDRSANEIVIGVRITAVNTHEAKQRLERVGFAIGAASYVPVRN